MLLLGKVARSCPKSAIRRDVFIDGSLPPQIGRLVRRVGRPRQDWLSEVWKAGAYRLGGDMWMRALLLADVRQPDVLWRREVDKVFQV